ncbi:unnamed protein product [Didymodactylos carnosus]|uniref:U-box domain-containing protein n=1 Tax=Didymodactylos carnosus TaxID=1234261 RepID=A0A814YZZ9_9BILA|nr:unnamed protein product [Didymodactylos carnosus]CAF1237072.1 unnamed protein product [Didymodactylos carnosus]CAF3647950.1 unnamed protein product [Didymodactylos carnosus]CAF3999383.1 unnamed protein product [Didymodactylos carnosus]
MVDPVMDPDGNSYERRAINDWLMNNSTSPITRNPLTIHDLTPNRALRQTIEQFKAANNVVPPALVTPAAVEAQPVDVDLKVSVSYGENCAYVLVKPPVGIRRTPCDICCVVDTSGSMQLEVETKDEQNMVEKFGLSQLDLVKHALKTIIHTLNEHDRLSVVEFNRKATVLFQLLKMTQDGKTSALAAIERLEPDGATNLWDGLKNGLDILSKGSTDKSNSALFILTDGCPNEEPPRGHIPTLKRYKTKTGFSCTINTFGFGYTLDSQLLEEIAIIGNGTYSFIPDGGFVGTIFINALSSLLTTVATNASLEVKPLGSTVLGEKYAELYETEKIDGDGLKIHIGSVTYDQQKSVIIPLLSSASSVTVALSYTSPLKKKSIKILADEGTMVVHDLAIDRYRLEFIDTVRTAMNFMKTNEFDNAQNIIKAFGKGVKSSTVANDPFIVDLMKDLEGQVTEAISKQEWFERWGKLYLPSLTRAHLMKICNNFKDPGVQHYGGELFNRLRDEIEQIFISLPSPKPSARPTAEPVPMAAYMNYSAGCFHGNCIATLKDGQTKPINKIQRGDILNGGARVVCVVETLCDGGTIGMIKFDQSGLLITPWHPVRINGKWSFPDDIGKKIEVKCKSVFNLILDSGHIALINGIECVTLGHGFKEEVVAHEYYGTTKVLDDLREFDDFDEGHVMIKRQYIKRDPKTGLVHGMQREKKVITILQCNPAITSVF